MLPFTTCKKREPDFDEQFGGCEYTICLSVNCIVWLIQIICAMTFGITCSSQLSFLSFFLDVCVHLEVFSRCYGQKQSCNNALMAKKSPKDNKCPKSQEIRRRKNSQVNITQGARKYTKYTKVYHMTKVEWGKIHRSKTKLNHQKEVRERGDRTN